MATSSMRSAPAVEAAAMSTSPMEPAPAVEAATFETTPFVSASVPATIIEAAAMTPAVPASPVWMSPAVVPRACADKDPVHKPGRPVIPVRRASIRIVRVIPIVANRRARHIAGTNADANADSDLSLRIGQRQGHQCEQCKISQILHGEPPLLAPQRFVVAIRRGAGYLSLFCLKRLLKLELKRRKKVAERGLADFNHPA